MASPRTCRRNAATTTIAACAALLFVVASQLSSLLPSSQQPSAFVNGAPGSRQPISMQRSALSDAERAAVLRLPKQREEAAEVKQEVAQEILASTGSKIELSASQRAALRLTTEQEQADFIKKMEDKAYMEEIIAQEQAISDGSAMGTFGTFFYYAGAAAVLWTWIMNFYRVWQLGHPDQPQF